MYLRPAPAGSVTQYQRKDVTKSLNKCRSRSVSMFLSRTAPTLLFRVRLLFQWRNVKLCQEDIASLFLSRGPGWSPRMCLGRCVSLLVVVEALDLELVADLGELEA